MEEKKMRTKSGFHLTVNDVRLDVHFRSYNQKIVRCWIKDTYADRTFVGIAKRNCVEDQYDETTGRRLAFGRAMEKRAKFYDRHKKIVLELLEKKGDVTFDQIVTKYDRLEERKVLACKEKTVHSDSAQK